MLFHRFVQGKIKEENEKKRSVLLLFQIRKAGSFVNSDGIASR